MSIRLLSPDRKVLAIGGGHGLSQVLKAFSYLESNLSAIVTTSDNGGSSGRIRKVNNNIAWGDIRLCLTSLIDDELAHQILSFRFKGNLELGGHNLGNILFTALEQMGNSPLDAIDYIKPFINIKANIFPMSETPVDLKATLNDGTTIIGETQIDNLKTIPKEISLYPKVNGIEQAQNSISDADIIILGPGSFFTSILPPLLIPSYARAIAQSNAKLIFIDNLSEENSPADYLTLPRKIKILENTLDRRLDNIILKETARQFADEINSIPQSEPSKGEHCHKTLGKMISSYLQTDDSMLSAS